MDSAEERFSANLALCENLLKEEKTAIERNDADLIEDAINRKEDAFDQLKENGSSLGYAPSDRPEFASRIEGIFAAQQANLGLMKNAILDQKVEGKAVQKGKARLRLVKSAYRS